MGNSIVFKFLNNVESYICRTLLACFVLLLFAQIISREVFQYSIAWSEELATYMFVWFVFFGASYAAKLSAHNRVTFQFNALPKIAVNVIEGIADLFWLAFNVYFIYLSLDFIFFKMNLFWKSQTLGIPMKYFYMILPIAFTLMSIRIIQVNYYKLVLGVDIHDPEKIEVEQMIKEGEAGKALKFYEVQKYVTNIRYIFSIEPLIVSEMLFQDLNSDMQELVLKAGQEATEHSARFLRDSEAAIKEDLIAKGMQIDDPADGEKAWIEKATQAVWPQFYDSIGGKDKLDKILAILGRG